MTLVHIHLALTHVPVVGISLCTVLLLIAWRKKSAELARIAKTLVVAIALVSWVPYFTGEAAEDAVEHLPGVREAAIETHEDAALVALVMVQLLGVASLLDLLWNRGTRVTDRRKTVGIALAAVLASLTLAWTANLGGKIRHTELTGQGAIQSEFHDDD